VTADTAVADFFSNWDVYRAVIDNNCMEHREIYQTVAPILARRVAPFSILDLGCGDAAGIAPLLPDLPLARYVGVDCAAPALEHARAMLTPVTDRIELHVADMQDFLAATEEHFDVILVSFALHHLPTSDKLRFLRAAWARLLPDGEVILIDVVRKDTESRDQYLRRYAGLVSQWPVGTERQRRIVAHVTGNDFPEEVSVLPGWASAAGFTSVEEFYRGGQDTQAGWILSR